MLECWFLHFVWILFFFPLRRFTCAQDEKRLVNTGLNVNINVVIYRWTGWVEKFEYNPIIFWKRQKSLQPIRALFCSVYSFAKNVIMENVLHRCCFSFLVQHLILLQPFYVWELNLASVPELLESLFNQIRFGASPVFLMFLLHVWLNFSRQQRISLDWKFTLTCYL